MNSTRRYQALYFVFFASFSGFVAFRNVLLQEFGMSGVQMGFIGALWVAGGVVSQPVWGFVADYTQSPTRVLGVAASVSGVAILSYPLGAGLATGTFAVVALGTLLFSATRAPIVPISNSLVLRQGFDYGQVRSFGSMAFGLAVLVIGFALSRYGTSLVVYLYAAGMVVFVLLLRGTPRVEERVFEGNLGTKAAGLVRRPTFVVLLATAFVLGMVSTSGAAFFSVYMRAVGLGDGLTGAAWAVKTVAETVLFLSLGRLTVSYGWPVAAGGLCYAAAYVLFTFTSTLPSVLLANVCMGGGVAFLYFSLVNLGHEIAPDGLHSTVQTLLMSVGLGAGGVLGQTAAGWLVDSVGVQRMYVYLAGGAMLLVVLGAAVNAVVREDAETAVVA